MGFYTKHKRVITPVVGETMTKQSFKDECDINNILRKYEKTGLISHLSAYRGRYEELPSNIDYQESLHAIMEADQAFASLPSRLRSRFDNDPALFLEFVGSATAEQLVEVGLAEPRQAVSPQATQSNAGEQPAAPKPEG